MTLRLALSVIGALAGLSLYALMEGVDQNLIPPRAGLILGCFFSVGFGASLLMSSAMRLRQALTYGFGLALFVSLLTAWASFRWQEAEGFFFSPWASFATLTISFVPLPFLMAKAQNNSPFNYEHLFQNTYSIASRLGMSVAFSLMFWIFLWLCDTLLRGIGLKFIGDIATESLVAFTLTGLVFGLAIAVSNEVAPKFSPKIGLWLLRLLLPVAALVTLIFIFASLTMGLRGERYDISSPEVLVIMAMVGVFLIALAVERNDGLQSNAMLITGSAKLMGLLVLILAAMTLWMLWQNRLTGVWAVGDFAFALLSVLLAGYGLASLWAVSRGANWGAAMRQVHLGFGLMVFAAAVLWLTPIFNAERMAASAQAARFIDGDLGAKHYASWQFREMGKAGEAAALRIRQYAEAKGDKELLAAVDGKTSAAPAAKPTESLVQEVEDILPVSPKTAEALALRDALFQKLQAWELEDILNACAIKEESNVPGCVLVVADLIPANAGDEGVLILDRGGWISFEGLVMKDGQVKRSEVSSVSGAMPSPELAREMIAIWQIAPPVVEPLKLNQLGIGAQGLFFTP